MNKVAINIYKLTIIITFIILIFGMFLVKEENLEKLSIIRYMMMYFCFGVIIPIGLIVREFFIEKYILFKMILKISVVFLSLVIGVIGIFTFIQTANIALTLFFTSLGVLFFIIIPTNPKTNK